MLLYLPYKCQYQRESASSAIITNWISHDMHCTLFTSCLFLRLQPLSVRIGLWARLGAYTFRTQLEGYVVRNEIPEYDASHVRFRLMCSHLWDAESENEILAPRITFDISPIRGVYGTLLDSGNFCKPADPAIARSSSHTKPI